MKTKVLLTATLCSLLCFSSYATAPGGGFAVQNEVQKAQEEQKRKEEEKAQQARQKEQKRLQEREERREDNYDRTINVVLPVLLALAIIGVVVVSMTKKKSIIEVSKPQNEVNQTEGKKGGIQDKLVQLKKLYTDGLISEEDYNSKKAKLLDEM